jgi:hypothetical protein
MTVTGHLDLVSRAADQGTAMDVAVPASSRWQRLGPILTLLVLSPVIGEVLSGWTRASVIFVLVPEIMVWGCGTLLIRDLVRRWRGGGASLLLLGLALAVAEEVVIQQTSIAPLPWKSAGAAFGRVWGVNWPYFLFMLGYETVWIVLVPIQVSELLFPLRRDQPWLRPRGLMVTGGVFLVGSLVAWYLWTQVARRALHAPLYHPPLLAVLLGVLAIALLGAMARAARRWRAPTAPRSPPPWAAALGALVLGFPWYVLLVATFGRPTFPLSALMLPACAWGVAAVILIGRWVRSAGWQDRHRWALAFAALIVSMLGGFLGAGGWSRLDTIAKAAMNVAAVGAMILLRARMAHREPTPGASSRPS